MTTHTELAAKARHLAYLIEVYQQKLNPEHLKMAATCLRDLSVLSTERLAGGGEPAAQHVATRQAAWSTWAAQRDARVAISRHELLQILADYKAIVNYNTLGLETDGLTARLNTQLAAIAARPVLP